MKEQPNCPFCNSEFGTTSEFMWGCTSSDCPEQPRYHDPVGRTDYVEEFWALIIEQAPRVKAHKQHELNELRELVEKYYVDRS